MNSVQLCEQPRRSVPPQMPSRAVRDSLENTAQDASSMGRRKQGHRNHQGLRRCSDSARHRAVRRQSCEDGAASRTSAMSSVTSNGFSSTGIPSVCTRSRTSVLGNAVIKIAGISIPAARVASIRSRPWKPGMRCSVGRVPLLQHGVVQLGGRRAHPSRSSRACRAQSQSIPRIFSSFSTRGTCVRCTDSSIFASTPRSRGSSPRTRPGRFASAEEDCPGHATWQTTLGEVGLDPYSTVICDDSFYC
jgi:hypothetical protein